MAKEELNFKDILLNTIGKIKLLLKKWKLILIISFLGAVLGVLYASVSKPNYIGRISIIIEEEGKGSSSGLASLASSFGLDGGAGGGLFSKSNILEFLKTRSLNEKTLLLQVDTLKNKNKTFAQLYIEANNWKENWKENKKMSEINFKVGDDRSKFSRTKDSILGVICHHLREESLIDSPDDENSLIVVEFKTKSELFSKRFPEKLVENVSSYYVETKTKKAKLNIDILQRQVDSVRMELNSSLTGLARATDDVFALNPAMNIKRIPSSKKQVDVSANTQILSELVKNLEISKMDLYNKTPFVQVIDAPVFPLEMEKLGKFKAAIIGGFLGGLLIVIFILLKDYFNKMLKEN
jgi:uncharacterized protein involved in exopolysaccharide biosynthesis